MLTRMIKTEVTLWPWIQSRLQRPPISELLRHLDDAAIDHIEQNREKFLTLVQERPFLMAQYRIQAAHLLALSKTLKPFHPKLEQEIQKTLRLSVLLKKIYLSIDEPDDEARMDTDIAILKTILYKFQCPGTTPAIKIPKCKPGFSQQLRNLHFCTNLPRLAAIRTRRLVLTCVTLQAFARCQSIINQIECFTNPFFLYLGWSFFFPRLLLNICMLIKKGLYSGKSDLPWNIRLEAYLNLRRRLYELWSDAVWFVSGLLLCFVLFGPLASWRPLTTVLVQISDTVMMITRSFIELRRLFVLKNEYLKQIEGHPEQQNASYLKALEERIAFEKKASYLAITNNALMTIAFLTLLPSVIALHASLPLFGAILGVLTTIRFYFYNAANETQQPRVNLNLLLKHYDSKAPETRPMQYHFFKPEHTLTKKLEPPQLKFSHQNTP